MNSRRYSCWANRSVIPDVDSIFHIKVAGINILNVVDSWIDSETMDLLSQTSPWDMVLWPFQTMREIEVLSPLRAHAATRELPEEWLEQLNILKPRFIVPSSCQFVQEDWSWYNQAFFPISYAIFKKQIESALPDTHVTRMNPSASFILDKSTIQKAESLSWIKPIGQQDLDYQYDSNLKPPSTAETSKRFLALDVKQTERVFSYCRLGLLEKYKLIAQDFDPYFEKSKLWRLSIYDHTGKAEHFFYKLKGKKIELTNDTGGQLSWTTEIPISKLYGALEYGESLTSLYIRINDMVFNPEIEKKIASVDIVEDPLIRCLFNDAFGAYQKAQLVQIKEKNNN